MKSLRPVASVLLAASLLASAGCRTAGVNDLARQDAPPSRAEQSAAELLSGHNRNAEKVQSLEAKSTISSANRGAVGGLSGKLALELPRNFKLEVSGPIHVVADLGSNDQEFWFWSKDSDEKAVYYCNYDETGSSPLSAAGLQPDWIIEALGLRVISDQEAARIKVSPGKDPGTLVLTERQKTSHGDPVVKDTVINEATGQIREHWVYASDHKTPLAHAVLSDYQNYNVPGETKDQVYLPRKIRLEWMQKAKRALDVTLSNPVINPKFSEVRRKALFVEPKFDGYARVNLDRTGMASTRAAAAGSTSVRESLPAPPPRVRLTAPSPLRADDARRTRRDTPALAAGRGVEELISPPLPSGSDSTSQVVQARSGWRGSPSDGLER